MARVKRQNPNAGVGSGCCEECGCQLAVFEDSICDNCNDERDDPDDDFEYDQSYPW